MSDFTLSETLPTATLRSAMQAYCKAHAADRMLALLKQIMHPKRVLFFPVSNRGPRAHQKFKSLKDTPTGKELHVYSGGDRVPRTYNRDALAWCHVSELVRRMQALGAVTIIIDDGAEEAIGIGVTEDAKQAVFSQVFMRKQLNESRKNIN